ncbi:MAG: Sensor histidine kinase RcsC [Syntrophus sp. SKADARSKE-3]|nr:Sensor histidine kinase RcsC [Syntrophus sp. SKADARSKE-3]
MSYKAEAANENELPPAFFENAGIPMFILDEEGMILLVNRAFEKMSGFRRDQIEGKKRWTAFVIQEDLGSILTAHEDRKDLVHGDSLSYEFRFRGSSTPACHVLLTIDDIFGTRRRIAAVHDMTLTKKNWERLQTMSEAFKALAENTSDAVVRLDEQLRYLYVNPVMEILTGIAAEKFIGRTNTEVGFPAAMGDYLDAAVREVFLGGGSVYVELQLPLGQWIEGIIRPEFLSDGSIGAAIMVAQDITDRKRVEPQRAESQKLEAIGTLADGIAHEFNNVLMGIQGYVSLMHFQKDGKRAYDEKLQNIEQLIEKGANLTKQLLGFAQNGMYEVQPTDMNHLLMESSEMFGLAKREIQIHRSFAEDLSQVAADRDQLNQVFMNLYINAWQAMPAGGDLYLETRNIVLATEETEPFGFKPGDYIEIVVRDTGVGMDDKTRQRIFEPFFTTKGIGGGTGLGLAFVYGIIKNHGGIIRIFSEKGKGAMFRIYLPAVTESSVALECNNQEVAEGGSMETILVVDDEEINIEVMEEWLDILGYKVMTARNGQEAIAIYQEHAQEIDLVLLDMIMPGMNGGEVFDVIKAINPDIRVILSSGYSIDGKAKEILQRGIKAFIQKPFRMDSLAKKIREVLSS